MKTNERNGVLENHAHRGKDSEKVLKSEGKKALHVMVMAKENK